MGYASYRAHVRRPRNHRNAIARTGTSAVRASRRLVVANVPSASIDRYPRSCRQRGSAAHCQPTRSIEISTNARTNDAVMVSAKTRVSARIASLARTPTSGRSQIATLANMNGSRSSQSARAAAPAVRLPQR